MFCQFIFYLLVIIFAIINETWTKSIITIKLNQYQGDDNETIFSLMRTNNPRSRDKGRLPLRPFDIP